MKINLIPLMLFALFCNEVVADPTGRIFVTNERGDSVSVINGNSLVVEATIDVGDRPRGIGISPDGSELYVAVSEENKIKVIAPKTLSKRKLENRILTSLNEVENGVFGTTHPTSNKEYTDPIDLCIVPGAAFDKSLSRLGYGGGYYDTFLANYPNAEKVAVCFKEQFVESVPTESHDVKMNKVVC